MPADPAALPMEDLSSLEMVTNMDRSTNDLATFVEAFNLKNAIYIGRHGTKCVAKAVC